MLLCSYRMFAIWFMAAAYAYVHHILALTPLEYGISSWCEICSRAGVELLELRH